MSKRMMSNFEIIQGRVFFEEGGVSNDHHDHGGLTNYGITIGTFKQYAEADLGIMPTDSNLKKITKEQATLIYKKHYWNPLRVDEINSVSIAHMLYDFHVNSPMNAVRIMQESLNSLGAHLTVDNIMGSKTIESINHADSRKLFDVYHKNRTDFYIRLVKKDPSQKVFLSTWLRRVERIQFEG